MKMCLFNNGALTYENPSSGNPSDIDLTICDPHSLYGLLLEKYTMTVSVYELHWYLIAKNLLAYMLRFGDTIIASHDVMRR